MGISCDSSNPITLKQLGRGNGKSVEKTKQIFNWIDEFNISSDKKIYKKLNTVVTKLNFQEDMGFYVKSLGVQSWKIFQVLPIENENINQISNLEISKQEFEFLVERHRSLESYGIELTPEDN